MKIQLPDSPLVTPAMREAVKVLEALTEIELQIVTPAGKLVKATPVIEGGKAILRIDLR